MSSCLSMQWKEGPGNSSADNRFDKLYVQQYTVCT